MKDEERDWTDKWINHLSHSPGGDDKRWGGRRTTQKKCGHRGGERSKPRHLTTVMWFLFKCGVLVRPKWWMMRIWSRSVETANCNLSTTYSRLGLLSKITTNRKLFLEPWKAQFLYKTKAHSGEERGGGVERIFGLSKFTTLKQWTSSLKQDLLPTNHHPSTS